MASIFPLKFAIFLHHGLKTKSCKFTYSCWLWLSCVISFYDRSDIDPDNPQHEQYAASVVAALIQELETKALTLTNEEFFLTKIKLQGAAEMFRVCPEISIQLICQLVMYCLPLITSYDISFTATLQSKPSRLVENHSSLSWHRAKACSAGWKCELIFFNYLLCMN